MDAHGSPYILCNNSHKISFPHSIRTNSQVWRLSARLWPDAVSALCPSASIQQLTTWSHHTTLARCGAAHEEFGCVGHRSDRDLNFAPCGRCSHDTCGCVTAGRCANVLAGSAQSRRLTHVQGGLNIFHVTRMLAPPQLRLPGWSPHNAAQIWSTYDSRCCFLKIGPRVVVVGVKTEQFLRLTTPDGM